MAVPAHVRSGRAAALLMGVQAAKASPVSNFASGSAGAVWSEEYGSDVGRMKSAAAAWMTSALIHQAGRFNLASAREGQLRAKATPALLEWLLRSNWGAFSAGAFTLASQVSEWLTLGFIEDTTPSPQGVLHRIYDAWPHTLALLAELYQPLIVEAAYAAEREVDPENVEAVVHPARPMFPADSNIFPGRLVTLHRDPTGENEEIPWRSLALTIDQRAVVEWDMMAQRDAVYKGGHPGPLVTLELAGEPCDQLWRLIYDSRTGVKTRYRLRAEAPDPAVALQIDMHQVDWEILEIGHAGVEPKPFRAFGTAHYDGTNFMSISLS